MPESIPPNIAHNNKSLPATGEPMDELIFPVITVVTIAYEITANMEYIVKEIPCFFNPNKKSGIFNINRNIDIVKYSGVI